MSRNQYYAEINKRRCKVVDVEYRNEEGQVMLKKSFIDTCPHCGEHDIPVWDRQGNMGRIVAEFGRK